MAEKRSDPLRMDVRRCRDFQHHLPATNRWATLKPTDSMRHNEGMMTEWHDDGRTSIQLRPTLVIPVQSNAHDASNNRTRCETASAEVSRSCSRYATFPNIRMNRNYSQTESTSHCTVRQCQLDDSPIPLDRFNCIISQHVIAPVWFEFAGKNGGQRTPAKTRIPIL